MAETLTQRLNLILNDANEFVDINELSANFTAIDGWLIPCAKIRNNALQTVPTGAGATGCNYDTIVYDSWNGQPEGAMANVGAESITVRLDGLYLCVLANVWTANATGSRGLNLLVNGVQNARDSTAASAANFNHTRVVDTLALSAGDVITASCTQNSGGNLDLLSAAGSGEPDGNMLSVTWMGKKPS